MTHRQRGASRKARRSSRREPSVGAFAELAGCLVIAFETEGDRLVWAERIAGNQEEVIGVRATLSARTAFTWVHPDDLAAVRAAVRLRPDERDARRDFSVRVVAEREHRMVRIRARGEGTRSTVRWCAVVTDVTNEFGLEAVFRNTPVGLALRDDQVGVLLANEAIERLGGLDERRLVALRQELAPSDPGGPAREGVVVSGVRAGLPSAQVDVVPLPGRPGTVLLTATDVSSFRRLLREISDREAELRAVFDAASDGIVSVDASGQVRRANKAAELLFGGPSGLVGRAVTSLFEGGDREAIEAALASARTDLGSATTFRATGLRDQSAEFTSEITVRSHVAGSAATTTFTLRDVSERLRSEQALLTREDRLRAAVACDLHDSVGQLLAGARLLMASLEADVPEALRVRAGRILDLLGRALTSVHGIARGIGALHLERGSLRTGLESLASLAETHYGASCALEIDECAVEPPPFERSEVLLVAQEAVMNAIRHSGSRFIDVSWRTTRLLQEVDVRDQGTKTAWRERASGGLGIGSMSHRAHALGGKLSIVASPEGGTLVRLTWPLRSRSQPPSSTRTGVGP